MTYSPFLVLIILVVGVLIGGVGIGGVLLVPALTYLAGTPVHEAIPACMLGYVTAGAVGTAVFRHQGSVDWEIVIPIAVGALPGAYAGAYLLPLVPAGFLEMTIAWLVLASGIHALKFPVHVGQARVPGAILLGVIGFLVGSGSAMTGTGGPLLLMPVLLWFRVPTLTAVGLSQVVQIPIALMATAGNLVHGAVNWNLGLIIAAGLAAGVFAGARVAHVLPSGLLKKSVALVLAGTGFLILLRLGFG